MANDNMHVEDGSGDRKYFTIIPNFVLNHSTANDQALYLQMKRIAGDGGVCEAGSRHFMKQLGIGRQAYNTSLEYLIGKGWITKEGKKKVITQGGVQELNVYRVNDLWQLNNAHFSKGGSKSAPLKKTPRGGSRTASKVRLNQQQGGSYTAPKKNVKKEHKEETLLSFNSSNGLSKKQEAENMKKVEAQKEKIRKQMGWPLAKV